MEELNFLHVTKKELFYTAVMLQLRQLVNVVYDFPADENKFDQELSEARSSLRKKKLLTESARSGINLSFTLILCAIFCANPESCEVIDINDYHATIYKVASAYMLMERRSENDLAAVWFAKREFLDEYIRITANKIIISEKKEKINNGEA